MGIDRYRRKQLAKRDGSLAPVAPPPADAPAAERDPDAKPASGPAPGAAREPPTE